MDHLHVRHCPQIPRLFAICSCCRRNLNVAGFLPLYSVMSLGPTRQCLFQNKMSKRFDLNSLEAASFAQWSLSPASPPPITPCCPRLLSLPL